MTSAASFYAKSAICAQLGIGDGDLINRGASLVAELAIAVGEHVCIGYFAAIYDSDYHAVDEAHAASRAPVTIRDNVWLGRGAIVLPGSDRRSRSRSRRHVSGMIKLAPAANA
jgi:acetyltransferase-like isoleucine patch superfamily enzyme